MRIMAACEICSRASSPTFLPSRSTTTRSAHSQSSFKRCEMKMTLTPLAFKSAMTRINRSVSDSVRLEVGSSMITRREFKDRALAISSNWRCAIDSSDTGESGVKSTPSASRNGRVWSCSFLRSTSLRKPPYRGSRPMNTLAAASRFSKRFSS